MPDRLALRLHAFARTEHDDGAVQHAQAPLDFGREIDMPGRIQQIDVYVAPIEVTQAE